MFRFHSVLSLRKQVASLAFVALTLLLPQLSQASLIGQTITATYQDNTPFISSDTVVVGAGAEILGSDNTKNLTLDSILFSADYIDFTASSIVIQLSGGGSDMGGGYSNAGFNLFPGARFEFTGLSFSPDIFSGVGVTLSNAIGLSSADISFTANSLTLNNLGNLGIFGSTVNDHGLITLSLQTTAVPIPGMLPLFAVCLAGLGARVRRKRNSSVAEHIS